MKKLFLLVLIFICCTDIKSFGQAKTYYVKYAEAFQGDKKINWEDINGQSIVIDEQHSKITVNRPAKDVKDQIFRILSISKEPATNKVQYKCSLAVNEKTMTTYALWDSFNKSIAFQMPLRTGEYFTVFYQYR